MNHKFHKSRLCALIFGLLASELWTEEEKKVEQSIIEDEAAKKDDTKYTYIKDKAAEQTPGDSAMLFHIPGLTTIDSGGAMGNAQFTYRGLSNSRFLTNLDGLLLNNPVTGMLDANSMFLFAAKYLQTNAQSLSITLPVIDEPVAKGVIGYGSQNSIKIGGCAGTPIGRSSIFMATQLTSSNGHFPFIAPDDPSKTDIMRENNDQHRLQTVIKYQGGSSNLKSNALFAVNFHESGIAGYAFSPTKNLRSFTTYSGLSMGLATTVNNIEMKLNVANSLFSYRSTDIPKREEQFLASTHEITFAMRSLKLPPSLDFELAPQIVIERAYELDKTRIGGGLLMKRSMRWKGRLKPSSAATFSMLGFDGQGLIFKKDVSFTIEPKENISVTGRFMRQQRLPTFMELYANNRFFVGNPDLQKEGVWDLDFGTNIRLGSHTHIALNGFLGFLSDTIVYVPFGRGDQTRPTNITASRRYGIDTAVTVEPTNWFLFESKNSLLRTKIVETGSPLPNAPAFSGLSRVRFGNVDFLSLGLQVRYRTASNADIYGSIRTKPYALCDSILSARIIERIGLSLSISNIFNVKTARDTYEIPLSGTVFFAQVEVGNI